MPNPIAPVLILLLAAPAQSEGNQGMDGVVFAQLTIRQRIIIRIPREPVGPAQEPRVPIERDVKRIAEKKGPKCMPVQRLAGSAVARKDSVDLMMTDGSMMRAKLGKDCPALNFYNGFYLKPSPDGMLCADRDVIRARSGKACPISSFKRLEAKR